MSKPAVANTRVYQHHHLDSTRWDHIDVRDDDIVITTPYKCGTTWTQSIVAALIHGPGTVVDRAMSPWIDARFWGPIEPIATAANATPTRRFMKSHLALDGMRWDDDIKYVVVGRDTRDVFMSLLNHYDAYGDVAFESLNDASNPGEPIPRYDGDPHALWDAWISRGWFEWEQDGWPFWSHHHHLATWFTARDQPNVFLMHFADLKADAHAEIGRLAAFLAIDVDAATLDAVVASTQIDAVRERLVEVEKASGDGASGFFEGGVARFIYKGTNGRWRDLLTEGELTQYEAKMQTLDPAFRAWLEQGRAAL